MSIAGLEAPSRQQAVEKYYGKYPGVVIDNKARDDSGHRGEVLVEVPGILEDRDNRQLPLQAWAKPCFLPGFFFVPETGDYVWVEFAAGDLNSPIWSGVWYPKEKAPQSVDSEALTEAQKIIRSSSKSNLIIQMDESTGSIQIKDDNGNSILLDGEGITIKGMSINLGDKNASEHLLLGDTFDRSIWMMFANHSHTTALGPTSPPVPPAFPLKTALSEVVKST